MHKKEENKRQLFRVKVSLLQRVTIHFELADRAPSSLSALAEDLGVGGVGILLETPVILYVGQRVGEGTIDLPGIGPVPFEGVIKWHSGRRVGIEFTGMPERNQRLIFQFVRKRERELVSLT